VCVRALYGMYIVLTYDSKRGTVAAVADYPQVTALSEQLLYFSYHGGY
jgi:hypothetical protein